MPDPCVFISYHRADLTVAERVRAHLLAQRCKTWMDHYDIPAGAYWPDEIDRGLGAADFVVGLLSPDSVDSRNVKNEWDWAIQNGKRLILLQTRACVIPHRYVSINFIDAADEDLISALGLLVRTLGLQPKQAELPLPQTRYARSGDLSIAYQTFGEGSIDFVLVPGFVSHVEHFWRLPAMVEFLQRLGSFTRTIMFDKRGTGLSDRISGISTLEERMDDIRAVMDANGVKNAVIAGVSEGVPLSVLFAATYPERTSALVLYGGSASYVRRPDYPWKPTLEQARLQVDESEKTLFENWGTTAYARELLKLLAPTMIDDKVFVDWFAGLLRLGGSPGSRIALTRMNLEIDVRSVLPTIRVPTLVLHRAGDLDSVAGENKYLAEHIPAAVRSEHDSEDHIPWAGDQEPLFAAIEQFIASTVPSREIEDEPETVLATVVCVQGDEVEQGQLSAFAQREAFRFRGQVSAGAGVVASFDGPARAIRFADAVGEAAKRAGFDCRCGLHTGAVSIDKNRMRGAAVDMARALANAGRDGQLLATSIVRDLVAGSGIRFKPAADEQTARLSGVTPVLVVDRTSLQ